MNSPTATTAPPTAAPSVPQTISSSSGIPEKQFSPLVRQFLEYLKLEKHFSDYTVKSYGADLIQFGQFLCGEIGQLPGANSTDATELRANGLPMTA